MIKETDRPNPFTKSVILLINQSLSTCVLPSKLKIFFNYCPLSKYFVLIELQTNTAIAI